MRSFSLRTRLLAIVLVAAVLPLALVGLWLAEGAERSGEALLRERLDDSLARVAQDIGGRWVPERSTLISIGEQDAVQTALRSNPNATNERPLVLEASFAPLLERLDQSVDAVAIRTGSGNAKWELATEDAGPPIMRPAPGTGRVEATKSALAPTISASLDIFDRASGKRLGTLEAQLRVASLVSATAGWASGVGSVLAVIDRPTGTSLMPLPFEPSLLSSDRFSWGGDEWIASREVLEEPAVEIIAAAPLTPYVAPLAGAQRQGLVALTAVAVVAFTATLVLTRQTTRSLGRLAEAAAAVSRGQFDGLVPVGGDDEVSRVAQAFNVMTENLRRTINELAQRESAAAVGDFASSLAHEVRNPLTSIRIDLQLLQEELPEGAAAHEPVVHALRAVVRLDATVTGALRIARSGHVAMERIDMSAVLDAAISEVEPEVRARGAALERPKPLAGPVEVTGDRTALHQLFLNLLLNAAQAVGSGGRVDVRLEQPNDAEVLVRIGDTGPGLSLESRARVFEPFYSTKPEGTGLGLAIAQRIAAAHRATIVLESEPGAGTTALVRLPRTPVV